ncbi:hypothetical protein [Flavobacterium ginsengisoli]|uniref:hypothetical protein n=1 Tax=Flavobacterium ginsengisoli TaxID=871694 RepID=UPI0024155621|nr:hypothetical protein [Flavobacterium ginsengisoli]
MENFILLSLIACVVILFNNFSKLKKENEFLDSSYSKIKEDYKSLKKEIEEIKNQLIQPDFKPGDLTSTAEEIEIISEPIPENIPLIIPDAASLIDDISQESNIVASRNFRKSNISFRYFNS